MQGAIRNEHDSIPRSDPRLCRLDQQLVKSAAEPVQPACTETRAGPCLIDVLTETVDFFLEVLSADLQRLDLELATRGDDEQMGLLLADAVGQHHRTRVERCPDLFEGQGLGILQGSQPGSGPAHLGGNFLAPPAQLDLITLDRLDRIPVFFRIERGELQ